MPKCWSFNRQGPWSVDLAMIFLDTPLTGATKGTDYLGLWDNQAQGQTVLGEDLTVAGFGLWAPWDVADDRFYYDELNT